MKKKKSGITYVTKLQSSGEIIYSTYLNGSDADKMARIDEQVDDDLVLLFEPVASLFLAQSAVHQGEGVAQEARGIHANQTVGGL